MLILRRTSSSSRLPYRRRRRQNCNNNWHEEDFYREPSTNKTRGVPKKLVVDPSTLFESTFCQILLRLIDYSAEEISRRVMTKIRL
ncbi:unnamed protein product [Hymenolepis diminuta]|uniref:Uncharacterized protein n=1 Tax=Hymenolepis diminuta TaxID=6216 RepID=A0A564XZ98_HYMDI|nr:unnamed protein product [Hymenolepis diminuta]